jgi:hypothetical protein
MDRRDPPPGWTCPGIDRTKTTIRRVRWRLRRGVKLDEVDALLAQALVDLEAVRDENRALREWGRRRNGAEPPPTP